jgi:hypothetical protein
MSLGYYRPHGGKDSIAITSQNSLASISRSRTYHSGKQLTATKTYSEDDSKRIDDILASIDVWGLKSYHASVRDGELYQISTFRAGAFHTCVLLDPPDDIINCIRSIQYALPIDEDERHFLDETA